MHDLHIDDFCKDCAKVFIQLFKNFPLKSTLYVEDICGPDEPDEFGLHSPRFQACFSTVVWLAESDYVRYASPIQQEAFEHIVLTHRGFTFLTAFDGDQLHSAAEAKTRIQVIRDTLREGSSDKLKDLMLGYMKDSRTYS